MIRNRHQGQPAGMGFVQWFHFSPGDFSVSFLSILFEGVPFMFCGALLAGAVDAFLPAQALRNILPRNPLLAIVASAALGMVLPMCECGVVPVIRRMLLKGLPVSCGLTYLLAAPIVNPVVALSTYAAFRGQHPGWMASSRIGMGFGIAILAGLVLARIPARKLLNGTMLKGIGNVQGSGREFLERPASAVLSLDLNVPDSPRSTPSIPGFEIKKSKSFRDKLLAAIRCAGFDFLDIGFYLILGAALTALFNTGVNQRVIESVASNTALATGSMMGLALFLSLCSTSDAFIAANFTVFPAAAKMAFMVFGPMMDLKLLFMYGMVFQRKFAFLLAIGLFFTVGLVCLIWGGILK